MGSRKQKKLTSTPPLSLRARDTISIPLAVACDLARMASASPEKYNNINKEKQKMHE